jgi:segregation and condensation protein B
MAVEKAQEPSAYAEMLATAAEEPGTGGALDDSSDTPPAPIRIVEALLFVGGPTLTAQRVGEIIRGFSPDELAEAVATLNRAYRLQNRPYAIQIRDEGFSLAFRPKYRGVTEKLYGNQREARLSTAAIDVLSLVAYQQPASKAEVDSMRGADSGALLRQLVRRGLIQIVQRADTGPREVLYGTTPRFLEWFGLQSLDDLPRTQDLQQL